MSRPYSKRTRYVSAPVAVSSSVEQTTGQKSITLRGREFVTDVTVVFPGTGDGQSSLYTVNSTRISPTDSNLFSWLTAIAEKFEEYKLYGLAFTYEPQCTTNTTGCVGVYFDPDPTNTPPTTWQTFTNTGANCHGAAWAKHQLIVPRRYYADRKQYYVPDQYADANAQVSQARNTTSLVPIDPLEYYPGNVGVCSVGVLGTGGQYLTLGKLYLDYVITFQKATIDTVPRNAVAGLGYPVAANMPISLKTGKQVSPYFAQNSGSGMYILLNNTGVAPVFGVSVQGETGAINSGTLPSRYGDELWSWNLSTAGSSGVNALSNIIATQTQDLVYAVALDGLTGGTLVWHFENAEGNTSTLSGYHQSYAKIASGLIVFGTLHIHAGERISLSVVLAAGTLSAANSKIFIAPFTWGLDG